MPGFGTHYYKNSFIGRINPAVKFLLYIIFVAILFIPCSLTVQISFSFFVIIIFFVARLPQSMFWKTLLSVLIIFAVLMLVNWFTYRNPGYIMFTETSSKWSLLPNQTKNIDSVFTVHFSYNDDNHSFVVNGKEYDVKDFVDAYVTPKNINKFGKSAIQNALKIYFANHRNIYVGALWGNGKSSNWLEFVPIVSAKDSTIFEFSVRLRNVTPYALSWRTIVISIYVFFKIFTLIILSTILTSTTTSIELTYGLEDLLYPLKIFRFPVNEFAMILSITIRYIPTLVMEAHRVMNAQAARGVDFKNGGLKDKVSSITSLVIPMFSVAFRKANELAFAMEARGYNPRYLRSRYRHFSLKLSDIAIFTFAVMLLTFVVVFSVQNVLITTIGSFDWLPFARNLVAS